MEGVSGAEEALALIESGKRFDMLLCDLKMPRVSGMEFYAALLAGWPEQAARVVLMTGGEYHDRAADFQRPAGTVSVQTDRSRASASSCSGRSRGDSHGTRVSSLRKPRADDFGPFARYTFSLPIHPSRPAEGQAL